MEDLREHLHKLYPKNSPLWIMLRVAFLNDYHRACRDYILVALSRFDKELAGDILMSKVIGGALYTAYEWLRLIDQPLADMLSTKESRSAFERYLEIDSISESRDKVADLVYGEGYTTNLRDSIQRAFSR